MRLPNVNDDDDADDDAKEDHSFSGSYISAV